jgi:hypothetical protein
MSTKQISWAVQSPNDKALAIGSTSFPNATSLESLALNDPETYFFRKTIVVDESNGHIDGCATDFCMNVNDNAGDISATFINTNDEEYELSSNDFVNYAEQALGQSGWNILAGPDPKHRPKYV